MIRYAMNVTQEHLNFIVKFAKDYGATKVLLFGSAFDNPTDASDIDIATDIPVSLIDTFAATLEETMMMPIDVVPLIPPTPFTRFIQQYSRILL